MLKFEVFMTVIVCLSEGGGMLFNKRRQSRDRKVLADIAVMIGDKPLRISDFSLKYLSDSGIEVAVSPDPLGDSEKGDFVFVENLALLPYADKTDRLVIYKWNTVYPTDTRIDINPEKEGMALESTLDFEGYSHEKITKEIWVKRERA